MKAKPLAAAAERRADLAAIHIAKATLRWDEDEYRDVTATVCGGIRSSAELDFAGRKRFLAHLQACQRANGIAPRPGTAAKRRAFLPHEGKMWALWMQLADAGLVQQRNMKAINSWVRAQVQVDSTAFLNKSQQELLIERLKQWLKRGEEEAKHAA